MRLDVNGTTLSVDCVGRGVPLLLLHGGLGWDHRYLRPLGALRDAAQLVFYDQRGNGLSARPEGWWEGVTHATWVEDADALRDRLGFDQVVLFGHSYGGFLAQEYALRYPERLRGLVLCSTAPAMDYPDVVMANARARATAAQLQAVLHAFSGPLEDDRAMADVMASILPLYFHEPRPELLSAFGAEMRYSAAAFNHAFGRCIGSFDTLERLGEIEVPTLVLSGADDWIMPLQEGGARLHRRIAGSELVVFARSGHFPFLEEPERCQAVLRRWLGALETVSAATMT